MNRGIHTTPNKGKSTDWITPPEIIEALGPFDLDPCAHPQQPFRTAEYQISPPTNGLEVSWKRNRLLNTKRNNLRIWLNPPYGKNQLWLRKMAEHNNGIALLASRTEVEKWFFPFVWESATAILFIRGRLYYYYPSGQKAKGNAGHGSVLVAYGEKNAAKLLSQSVVKGKFIYLK